MEYPKINSLFKREGHDFNGVRLVPKGAKLIIGDYACPEFDAIKTWSVTEKVDGTNVRIIFDRTGNEPVPPKITFKGRTEDAQMPTTLLSYLQEHFTIQRLDTVFKESNYVVLFGEGYGPKIQSGGYYRDDVGFILFDAYVSGWWLARQSLEGLAISLECPCVSRLSQGLLGTIWTVEEIVEFVQKKPKSFLAKKEHEMEGIVARSDPLMLFRNGLPVMFKLKCKDL